MFEIRHFLLTSDGSVQLIEPEMAAAVAAGETALPDLAATRARYLQVIIQDKPDDQVIQVRTAGALVGFDPHGKVDLADSSSSEEEGFTRFEHDTCVQLALDGVIESDIVVH